MAEKRGSFFSVDALIAALIIVIVLIVVPSFYVSEQISEELILSEDVVNTLSTLSVGEINDVYIQGLIASGDITDVNKSVLEQIGEFWAKEERELAENVVQAVLSSLADENIGIWVDNELVYVTHPYIEENITEIKITNQLVSGVEKGQAVVGYSARAFLRRGVREEYAYFGGYVGDGDVTVRLNLENMSEVKQAIIEAAVSDDFELYVNGVSCGTQTRDSDDPLIPTKWNLSYSCLQNFDEGINYILFENDQTWLYVAGGYIKVVFETGDDLYMREDKKWLPGIYGIANLYSSFYVPGDLNSLEVYLHYYSNYTTFFVIGNETVFNRSSNQEESVTLTDSDFSMLDYDSLSRNTIPIRFGVRNVTQTMEAVGNADVVLITDLSGSMRWCLDGSSIGCTGVDGDNPRRLELAKVLDKNFVDIILGSGGNKVGLVTYNSRAYMTHDLSNDQDSLESTIEEFSAGGATCICCAVRAARLMLQEQSSEERDKYIIVMTDGIANRECNPDDLDDLRGCNYYYTYKDGGWRLCFRYCSGECLRWVSACNDNVADVGINQTIEDSCRAREQVNATVYSIGFATKTGCDEASYCLQGVADCGNGTFYASDNTEDLEAIYANIAGGIVNISFFEQTAVISGNLTTELYTDSYIDFSYTADPPPYGTPFVLESDEFGNEISEGTFTVPLDMELVEARAVSYSGAKWTDIVAIQDGDFVVIYNLSQYGSNYVRLGDPYEIQIPTELISEGTNTVKITTGLSPTEKSGGSPADKVIYTVINPGLSAYSSVLPTAEGCLWYVYFEDGTSIQLNVPDDYAGENICNFTTAEYNHNDATNEVVYKLLENLDLDSDGLLDIQFSTENLDIEIVTLEGIPYMWLSTLEVRTWR